jgi:uncharacterized protein (DUF2141 family)
LALLASPVIAANLEISVTGVRSDRGSIAVAICDKTNFPTGDCPYRGRVPAKNGNVSLNLSGVPAGIWAAAVYHDETSIGRLRFSLLGAPEQGVGFSNDAKMNFGPPSFADAAFTLRDPGGAIAVPLHYPSQ